MSIRNKLSHVADRVIRVGLRSLPPSKISESAALWWGYRFNPSEEVVTLRSGAVIKVSDVEHSQILMRYMGTFEPHCLSLMKRYARPGGNVIDVGANIGLYTVEASRAVGPSGRVIAIEAAPCHAATIRQSAKLNGARNVTVVNTAVGDEPGEAALTLPAGGNMGMFTLGNVAGPKSYKVQIRTIDDIISDLHVDSVDFVKMDIEGSEFRALNGARKTLEKHRPPILIELNETALRACGSSCRQVKGLLTDLGYTGRKIDGRNLTPISVVQEHVVDECLFVCQ